MRPSVLRLIQIEMLTSAFLSCPNDPKSRGAESQRICKGGSCLPSAPTSAFGHKESLRTKAMGSTAENASMANEALVIAA